MKASDILDHFLSRADWVDPDTTVDRVIVGDPDADFARCMVTWMPSSKALRYMVHKDIRLLICHEPTFWNHSDDRPRTDDPGRLLRLLVSGLNIQHCSRLPKHGSQIAVSLYTHLKSFQCDTHRRIVHASHSFPQFTQRQPTEAAR